MGARAGSSAAASLLSCPLVIADRSDRIARACCKSSTSLGRSLVHNQHSPTCKQARADAIAAIPQLPKDTESKLAAALEPALAPSPRRFPIPLVDRAGVSQISRSSVSLAPAALSNIPLCADRTRKTLSSD